MSLSVDGHACPSQMPIHVAVSTPQKLDILIREGHGLDSRDKDGVKRLMYATAMDKEQAFFALIEAGADPTIRDSCFFAFVDYAALCGY